MRPALGFVALMLVAIGLIAYTSRGHMPPDLTPAEKTQQEEEAARSSARTSDSAAAPSGQRPPPMPTAAPDRAAMYDKYKVGAVRATMVIENRGTLTLELYPKAAPQTVAHVTDLIKKHFYDGILFHRVVPDFVAQGGDPESKKVDPKQIQGLSSEDVGSKFHLGSAGSGQQVPLEATLPHISGSIGLARSQAEDSGDSQFFFNLKDNGEALDGKYCAFGRVVGGADLLSNIQIGDRITKVTIP